LNADPLLSVDKEGLVRTIREQERQIEKLRRENDTLRHEIDKLKDKPAASDQTQTKASIRGHSSKPPQEWGRKKGHKGSGRRQPDHIDRLVELTAKQCPKGHALGACEDFEDHYQEDIIPAKVEVTCFRHFRYWCGSCQDHVLAAYAPDEIPYAKLGPKVLTMMVLLKYYYALPGNKIKSILESLCGLTVSEGGISKALQRLAKYLQVETDTILTKIRQAALKHADETGWNVNGVNHWMWVFLNDLWVYYTIDRSRGAKVPKTLLGEKPPGTLISDFYEPYRKLGMPHQTCHVHLLREMRECRKETTRGNTDFEKPYQQLRRILKDADRLAEERRGLETVVYRRRVRRIKARLVDFASRPFRDSNWKRLSKRLLKHEHTLFTFLDQPGIPKDNNAAERAVRPQVIIRNRSFQNRTDHGATAHAILSSLTATLLQQKRNPLIEIVAAYPEHRRRAMLDLPPVEKIFASSSSPLN
jgi:transposase